MPTVQAFKVDNLSWVNAYTLSGIAAGATLRIQNLGDYPIAFSINTATPLVADLSSLMRKPLPLGRRGSRIKY